MRILYFGAVAAALCLSPPLRADDTKKASTKTFNVPFQLTDTKHVMVRAKLNGKGPFHFIIDTGAPILLVSTAAAQKAGVKPDKKGWGTFERFDLEGGVKLPKVKARIEDPFQLQGMNGLGLAGAELHGMIGYEVLARFRIELDLTRDKMTWAPLDFDPPPPQGLGGGGAPPELDFLGAIMKLAGGLLGKPPRPEVVVRGFLGFELSEDSKGLVVKAVTDNGPAAQAGLKAGDRLNEFQGRTVRDADGVRQLAAQVRAGQKVTLSVERDGMTKEVTLQAGEGL